MQRVLSSQHHPSGDKGQLAPSGPGNAPKPQSASRDLLQQHAEDTSGRARRDSSAPSAPEEAAPGERSAAEQEDAAEHGSARVGSSEMPCSDPLPREPISMQPFQRQLHGAAACSHASLVGMSSGGACEDLPEHDPQMEALLHEAQVKPSGAMQTTAWEQDWQACTDSPADSCSSDRRPTHFRQPVKSKKACLDEGIPSSESQAMPAASLVIALRAMQPARDAPELRAQEACAAQDNHMHGWTFEASGVAQNVISQNSAGGSEEIQGPSTPAGRPGTDRAKQDAGKPMQQPEMASLLQQDVASLKGQVTSPPRLQNAISEAASKDL